MKCILAIDSGGTKCDALLVRNDGAAIGWGHCGFRDPESGRGRRGSGRSEESVTLAVKKAIGDIQCDELHFISFGIQIPPALTESLAESRVELHLIREYDAALALAGLEWGLVALAGTGAFAYGKTSDGRTLWLDGLGPMLGDYGSGYQIGHQAIRAAARSGWHPRHETSLAEVVPEACMANYAKPSRFSLVEYMLDTRDRAEIASLARLVDTEANKGDRISRQIIEEAAASMAETIRDLVDRLGIANEDYTLVGTGSVATRSRIYWDSLCGIVAEFAPRLKPVQAEAPLAAGMVLAVLPQLEAECSPETFHRNLLDSIAHISEVQT